MRTVMATPRGWYNLCPQCFSRFPEYTRPYEPKYIVLRLFFLDKIKCPLFKVNKSKGQSDNSRSVASTFDTRGNG